MIGAQKILINSLPDGSITRISKELELDRIYVSRVLYGEINPIYAKAKEVIKLAGEIAALEIFEYAWDEKMKNRNCKVLVEK